MTPPPADSPTAPTVPTSGAMTEEEEEGALPAGASSQLGEPSSSAGKKTKKLGQGQRAQLRRRADYLAKVAAAEAAEKDVALGDEQAADIPAAPTPSVSW